MRFATYNLWNSDMPRRYPQLLSELQATDADVIALQECTPDFFHHALAPLRDWPCRIFEIYEGEEEGLALLSRFPIVQHEFLYRRRALGKPAALHALIDYGSLRLSVTNVHLPWDSVLQREAQAVTLQRYISAQQADFFLLMGDFNDDADSAVARFLSGLQSLCGEEASPIWNDLAHAWSCHTGQPVPPTLDPVRNPRWRGVRSPYAPRVMDRICLMDSYAPVSLENVSLFGQEVSPLTDLAASDHYGVLADVSFHP